MGEVRQVLKDAGGLVTSADLARLWGVSVQRAYQITRHKDFPEPVYVGPRVALYLRSEADAFRNRHRDGT